MNNFYIFVILASTLATLEAFPKIREKRQVGGSFVLPIESNPSQQFPQNPPNNQPQVNLEDPTTTAAPVTTASPEFLRCTANCPSTNQYNPVCGTDNITYPNEYRLECARRCGKEVTLTRGGQCTGRG